MDTGTTIMVRTSMSQVEMPKDNCNLHSYNKIIIVRNLFYANMIFLLHCGQRFLELQYCILELLKMVT